MLNLDRVKKIQVKKIWINPQQIHRILNQKEGREIHHVPLLDRELRKN
mgnify:CR=1 FL=1